MVLSLAVTGALTAVLCHYIGWPAAIQLLALAFLLYLLVVKWRCFYVAITTAYRHFKFSKMDLSHIEKRSKLKVEAPENKEAMRLVDLPLDILIHLMGYLEFKSKMNAWRTCPQLKSALARRIHLGNVNISRRRVPHGSFHFLRDISVHIEELNLNNAAGFTEAEATSTLSMMENLQSLDLAHTCVTINGVNTICAACPRLSRLCCSVRKSDRVPITSAHLDYLHLACEEHQLRWNVVEDLLQAPNLKQYMFTDCHPVYEFSADRLPWVGSRRRNVQCSSYHFSDYNFENAIVSVPSGQDFILILESGPEVQIILSKKIQHLAMRLSPPLSKRCQEIFTTSIREENGLIISCHLYLWHATILELNPNLYADVLREIDAKFIFTVCPNLPPVQPAQPSSKRIFRKQAQYDVYDVCHCTFKQLGNEIIGQNYDLNLIDSLPTDRKIGVSLCQKCTVTFCAFDTILKTNYPILKNIVHLKVMALTMTNNALLQPELSRELLAHCANLETLEMFVSNYVPLLEAVHVCKEIRNIHVQIGMDIDYDLADELLRIITCFCKCPKLENVTVDIDNDLDDNDLDDNHLDDNDSDDNHLDDNDSDDNDSDDNEYEKPFNSKQFKKVLNALFSSCPDLIFFGVRCPNRVLGNFITKILYKLGIGEPRKYSDFIEDSQFSKMQDYINLVIT